VRGPASTSLMRLYCVVLRHKVNVVFMCTVLYKDKVVPVLFLTGHHAMKAYWGVEV
jgi:hypothetical protein